MSAESTIMVKSAAADYSQKLNVSIQSKTVFAKLKAGRPLRPKIGRPRWKL
jgi:hypothetical protein